MKYCKINRKEKKEEARINLFFFKCKEIRINKRIRFENTFTQLNKILDELLLNPENECVEFKKAESDFDIDKLGKYFSAISNEATLKNKQYGWIVFGIDDKTHNFTNTRYHYDNNFNSVKKQISDNTTDNVTFIEIYNLNVESNRVIMFQVPAASGTPTNWKGFPYGRNGESIFPLTSNKIEQIKATANYDW